MSLSSCSENAGCRFEQSIKYQEYLIYLFSLFKDYCVLTEPKK